MAVSGAAQKSSKRSNQREGSRASSVNKVLRVGTPSSTTEQRQILVLKWPATCLIRLLSSLSQRNVPRHCEGLLPLPAWQLPEAPHDSACHNASTSPHLRAESKSNPETISAYVTPSNFLVKLVYAYPENCRLQDGGPV